MKKPRRFLAWAAAVYAVAWVAYVAKSAAGIDLIAYDAPVVGGHHGPWFPGSDVAVAWLRSLRARPVP